MTQNIHAAGVSGACPDVDALADLHADVLDDTTARELREHVAACARCTEVLAALDATVGSLAALPEVQMPADVAARIDRAIASEAGRLDLADDLSHLRSAESAAPSHVYELDGGRTPSAATQPGNAGANVASLAQHREKRSSRGRLLFAAAAAAAVLGIGAVVVTQLGSEGTSVNQAGEAVDKGQGEANPTAGDVQAFNSPKDVLDKGAIENDKVSPDVAGKMAELNARNQCLSKIPSRPALAPEAVQAGKQGGKDAYAFIFATKDAGTIQMIVVDAADCSNVLQTKEGPRD